MRRDGMMSIPSPACKKGCLLSVSNPAASQARKEASFARTLLSPSAAAAGCKGDAAGRRCRVSPGRSVPAPTPRRQRLGGGSVHQVIAKTGGGLELLQWTIDRDTHVSGTVGSWWRTSRSRRSSHGSIHDRGAGQPERQEPQGSARISLDVQGWPMNRSGQPSRSARRPWRKRRREAPPE